MARSIPLQFVITASLISALLAGCGSSKKEGAQDQVAPPTVVGSASCTNNCHAATTDITGNTIATVWANSTHTTVQGVQCESCHGGGSLHWGLGPIPFPNPQAAQCSQASCHPAFEPAFDATRHANGNNIPDSNFSQIPTPVSVGKHIEECSVCHNNNQRFELDAAGNLIRPNAGNHGASSTNSLPTPTVSCASCHDAHQAQQMANVATRTAAVGYPIFRKSQIAGAGPVFTPEIRATAGQFSTTELVCAACHTKGLYKHSQTATHQENVFSQWSGSAHNDKVGVPWNEISLTAYPIDLAVPTAANPGTCAKCHNGLTAPVFMNPSPTSRRPNEPEVVWNPATGTCVTCHDPHAASTGATKNVRIPAVMTNYSGAGAGIVFGNVFLDVQPLPTSGGNSTLCIFCHQGRESGFSLFKDKLAAGRTITGNFKNNHYLGTAAMLWGANAYEFGGKSYTSNIAHQQTNCTGCHMANPTEPVQLGGHTWRPNPASCTQCHPAITAATDLSLGSGAGFLAGNRATGDTTNFSGNPASVSVAAQIRDLQNYIIALLAANGVFHDDTVNGYYFNVPLTAVDGAPNNHASANRFTAWTRPLYKAAFNLAIAIKVNVTPATSTTYVLNGAGVRVPNTSQTVFPNKSAAVHNYKYVIELLMDSYTDLYNNSSAGQIAAAQASINAGPTPLTLPTPTALNLNRPAGTRQAVNYGAFVRPAVGVTPVVTYGGTYDPLQ